MATGASGGGAGDAGEPAATIAGVCHRFGDAIGLNDVSLTILAGPMARLIEPDGVGKSTPFGLVAGVRRLHSGRAVVLGSNMTSAAQRRRTAPRIAYMPQELGRNLLSDAHRA